VREISYHASLHTYASPTDEPSFLTLPCRGLHCLSRGTSPLLPQSSLGDDLPAVGILSSESAPSEVINRWKLRESWGTAYPEPFSLCSPAHNRS